MMKKSKIYLIAALAATALTGQADEGRLLRFPGTNGREVAFSYAGDIYTVPITGGTARHTMATRLLRGSLPTGRPLPSLASMTATPRCM